MKVWFKFVSAFLFGSLILFSCDNFWGYDYEADPIPNSAPISGKITNLFTHEPVYDAKVQAGTQSTRTDENGEFLLHYSYVTDEDRNKPVRVTVTAVNYFSYSKSIIIYPQDNVFNAELEYAAPLISKAVLVDYFGDGETFVCQALVKDYQGAEEIASVLGSFLYWNTDTKMAQSADVAISFDHSLSDIEAYYQLIYHPITEYENLTFLQRVSIVATDSSGYHGSIVINSTSPDSLLFPVQL